MTKSFILDEIGLEQANKLMGDATRKAIAQAHAHGLSVTVDIEGITSKIFPDGHIESAHYPNLEPKKERAA